MSLKPTIQREVLEIKLKPATIKKYKNEIKKLHKICNDNPSSFFSKEMKISNDVKKEFELHFSKKHYDSESAGWFEAWPVMNLLVQSMELGFRLGKDPKKFKKQRENLIKLMKKHDSLNFKPIRGYRDFNLFHIQAFIWENGNAFYIDKFNNQYSIKNPKLTKKKLEQYIPKWESHFLKTKLFS